MVATSKHTIPSAASRNRRFVCLSHLCRQLFLCDDSPFLLVSNYSVTSHHVTSGYCFAFMKPVFSEYESRLTAFANFGRQPFVVRLKLYRTPSNVKLNRAAEMFSYVQI